MRVFSLLALSIVCFSIFTRNIHAQTTSGVINKAEIWSGEVILTGDVAVAGGGRLTILPGTVVKAQSETDDQGSGVDANLIELIVDGGSLVASGTEAEHIIFTSQGKWYGIRHIRGLLTLQYCNQDAGVIGLTVESSVPKAVENCTFTSNIDKGASFTTSFKLIDCKFEANATVGLHCENGIRAEGCEINLNGTDGISGKGTAQFDKCTVTLNGGDGVNLNGTTTFSNCTVSFNGNAGVNITGDVTCTVDNCTITDNSAAGVQMSSGHNIVSIRDSKITNNVGAGINIVGRSGSSNAATVSNCQIMSNGSQGVRVSGSAASSDNGQATATISNCTITRNGRAGVHLSGGNANRASSFKTATVNNCTVLENSGGGVIVDGGSASNNTANINKCEVRANILQGVYSVGWVSITDSTITDNLDAGVALAGVRGFTKNHVARNTVGIHILSWADKKIDGITGNDISGNVTYELENKAKVEVEVVANENYWGDPTTAELQGEVENLTKVFDQKDNPTVGPVTISTFRTEPVIIGTNGDGRIDLPILTASVALSKGLNMISAPLNRNPSHTASSLATELDSTIVIRVENGSFDAYVHDVKKGNDFPIEMGRGYIVNLNADKTMKVTGKPWSDPPAAPPVEMPSDPWAFVIVGQVDGHIPVNGRIRAINLHASKEIVAVISTSGEFTATFVDMSRQGVVTAGDKIAIQLIGADGTALTPPQRLIISRAHINRAYLFTRLDANPKRTQLLPNYPNPFNPETWIPFQLAESSPVVFSIYNLNGRLVRRIDLGHRATGWHISKGRAAYWNGQNDFGERVGSGVYWMVMKTRNGSETRKMVVLK